MKPKIIVHWFKNIIGSNKSRNNIWTLTNISSKISLIYLDYRRILCNFATEINDLNMKGIIYARVSSLGDRQNTDRQIEDLTKYAGTNSIEVVNVFSEKISGAKRNCERKVLNQCISYAEANQIGIILCSEGSRLGRSTWEVLETIKHCIDKHINVYLQKENIHILREDGSIDPMMAVYISCLSMANEFERENIKFRLNSGRKLAIEKGVKMGRKIGSTKSHEQKENEYKNIIKLLRKGYSVASTYAIAKERGIKCSISTIKRLKKEFGL